MSAELLREAAAKMRERAEAAGVATWYVDKQSPEMLPDVVADCEEHCDGCGVVAAMVADPHAEHIASWSPPTALAVADLLEHAAARAESKIKHGGNAEPVWSHEHDALTVARAFLGRQP